MNLEPTDQSNLILWVAAQLRDASTSVYGTSLSANGTKPKISDNLERYLQKYLDRGGLVQFVEAEIQIKLLKCGYNLPNDDEVPLLSIEGLGDSLSLAEEIIGELKKVPRQYLLAFRGPLAFSLAAGRQPIDIRVSDRLSLVSSSLLRQRMIFTTGVEALDEWVWRSNTNLVSGRALADNYIYFTYDASGYIQEPYDSRASQSFLDEVRAFYGACLAHETLWEFTFAQERIAPIILTSDKSTKQVVHTDSVDSELVRATYLESKSLKREYRKQETFVRDIQSIINLFKCQNSERLRTAAVWILRARLSTRPMDKVLESAIALEVMLGDREMSDKVGLTKLMATRCAYSLGKTYEEREDISKFFFDFYKLRSEIVHSGRMTSDEKDSETMRRGVQLAARVLAHEQKLSGCG